MEESVLIQRNPAQIPKTFYQHGLAKGRKRWSIG